MTDEDDVDQAIARIEQIVADPRTDADVVSHALAWLQVDRWRTARGLRLMVHAYLLVMALGSRADARAMGRPRRGSDLDEQLARMHLLAARVVALRHGALERGVAPAGGLITRGGDERLQQQLARALGAHDWDATDALLPLLRRPPEAMATLLGLHIYAAALLHASPEGLASLKPLADERPALALLLRCRGVEAPLRARNEGELLAAVAAAPDDDGPRAVYADWLAERDPRDPRAELMRLQLGSPASVDPRRVDALVREHQATWLGPLAPLVVPASVRFRRGFLHSCQLRGTTPAHRDLLRGHPVLATVEQADFVAPRPPRLDPDLWPALRVVGGLDPEGVAALEGHPRVEAVGVRVRVGPSARLLEPLAGLPRLRALAIAAPVTPRHLSELPALDRLAAIVPWDTFGAWVEYLWTHPSLVLEAHAVRESAWSATWARRGQGFYARIERDDAGRPTCLRMKPASQLGAGELLALWPDRPLTRIIVQTEYDHVMGYDPPDALRHRGERIPVERCDTWPPLLDALESEGQ